MHPERAISWRDSCTLSLLAGNQGHLRLWRKSSQELRFFKCIKWIKSVIKRGLALEEIVLIQLETLKCSSWLHFILPCWPIRPAWQWPPEEIWRTMVPSVPRSLANFLSCLLTSRFFFALRNNLARLDPKWDFFLSHASRVRTEWWKNSSYLQVYFLRLSLRSLSKWRMRS